MSSYKEKPLINDMGVGGIVWGGVVNGGRKHGSVKIL